MFDVASLRDIVRRHGFRGAIVRAAEEPGRVVNFLREGSGHFYDLELPIYWEDIVTVVPPLVEADTETVVEIWKELENAKFPSEIQAEFARTSERPEELHSNWRELLYVLVRLCEPALVVETGVYDGLSSAYILGALATNGRGRLLSVDINDGTNVPADISDENVGWVVPQSLRERWLLKFGDSRDILPGLLEDASVDMFLHDSLHTADHMRYEFETVLKSMTDGGYMLTDNCRFNEVYREIISEYCDRQAFWKNTTYAVAPSSEAVDDRFGAARVGR